MKEREPMPRLRKYLISGVVLLGLLDLSIGKIDSSSSSPSTGPNTGPQTNSLGMVNLLNEAEEAAQEFFFPPSKPKVIQPTSSSPDPSYHYKFYIGNCPVKPNKPNDNKPVENCVVTDDPNPVKASYGNDSFEYYYSKDDDSMPEIDK